MSFHLALLTLNLLRPPNSLSHITNFHSNWMWNILRTKDFFSREISLKTKKISWAKTFHELCQYINTCVIRMTFTHQFAYPWYNPKIVDQRVFYIDNIWSVIYCPYPIPHEINIKFNVMQLQIHEIITLQLIASGIRPNHV